MNYLNIKYHNNTSVAQFLFDEIMVWAAKKRPSQNLSFFIKDIEKILDEIEKKGYNKGLKDKSIA